MGAARWSPDRLADEVASLGRRGLPREAYFAELAPRLRRVVDSDATCWHTLDPQTRLMTSDAPLELVEHGVFTSETARAAGALLVRSEYLIQDVNSFATLSRQRAPVGILSQVARGRPERSARYRDLLAPAGIPFELRAAFVIRGRVWGAVHVARRAGMGDFTRADADALASVAGLIAQGIRTSLRFDAARRAQGVAAPGLVVLDARNEVQLITAPARELLDAMRSQALAPSDETPPTPVLALAAFARGDAAGANMVVVPTASGWITLHASLPEGTAAGQVAIVLERAPGPQAADVRLEAHGVTAREREVATLLAQGLAYAEIATALVLSPYTVEDHVKSLFEKTGVASRQELVARIFLDDYLPDVLRGAPLTANGGLDA